MVVINNIYKYKGETVLVKDISYDENGGRYCLCVPMKDGGAGPAGQSFAVPEEHAYMLEPVGTECNGCLFHALREVKRRSVMEYKLYFSDESVCLYDDTVCTLDKPHRGELLCGREFYKNNCRYFKSETIKKRLKLADLKNARCAVNAFFESRTLACGTVHENGRDLLDEALKPEEAPWATRELDESLFKSAVSSFQGDRVLAVGNYPALLKDGKIEDECIKKWYEGVAPVACEIDRADFDYGMFIYLLSQYKLNAAFIDEQKKHGVFTLPFVSFLLENK